MKQLIICVAMLSLILSGIAFAGDEKQEQEINTIVGPVLQNRYVYISPQDDKAKERSEVTQKLLDQGVFTAVEDARNIQPVQGVQK